MKYTNTPDCPHLLPRTNGKKKVFEFLYKHSSTAITNSQRVKVVPAPYGVRQPVASYRPLARTTRNLTASTALCRYSLVPPTTLSPLLVARSTMQMATNADLRCHSVASFATYQSAASPLRLSGDSPDNRSGGAVRFNISQRAGCEGARESRGSHVVSLKEGW